MANFYKNLRRIFSLEEDFIEKNFTNKIKIEKDQEESLVPTILISLSAGT